MPDLIRSFAALARRRPSASLDLVGDNRTYPHEDLPRTIAAAGLAGRIRWHRYAAEDQLTDLYARARAFAFLSEYEGLGLTPLEALAAGVPPVLLDTPVARESCGDAALYVSRGDVEGTARALEDVLVDQRDAVAAAGRGAGGAGPLSLAARGPGDARVARVDRRLNLIIWSAGHLVKDPVIDRSMINNDEMTR